MHKNKEQVFKKVVWHTEKMKQRHRPWNMRKIEDGSRIKGNLKFDWFDRVSREAPKPITIIPFTKPQRQ